MQQLMLKEQELDKQEKMPMLPKMLCLKNNKQLTKQQFKQKKTAASFIQPVSEEIGKLDTHE